MPRISVVIPSYNHERFIGDAIRSVAAQEVDDLELVIIDDGSTDASVERIQEELEAISLERTIFEKQENRGAHAAIMRGIEQSSGDILAILNSDDRFAPQRLARMRAHYEGREDFLAFSKVRLIGASGALLPVSHPTTAGYRHALYEAARCPTVGFGLIKNNFAVTSGNFVFSRSLYDRLGGFSHHQLAHDWDFLLRAMVHAEPIFVPEPLIDYRIHETNTIQRVWDRAELEGREILNEFLACCATGAGNSLAPCPANWPLYFDLFISRHAPWFGNRPLRDWIDEEHLHERGEGTPADWRSWAEAVDFEAVDDCGYIVSAGTGPADLDAVAVLREVIVSESHPVAHEVGDGPEAIRRLFETHAHPLARVKRPTWRSPVGAAEDALESSSPSRARSLPGAPTSARLRTGARTLRAGLARILRAVSPRSESPAHRHIRRSGIFDVDYYLAANEIEGVSRAQAIEHYLEAGADRGFDPHPLFDTSYYLEANPDVARDGINPLLHYLAHGAAESRNPHPLFGSRFYLVSNPDVAASGMSPVVHYDRHGAFEGREPHPRFDSDFYRRHCPVEIPEHVSELAHYVIVGRELGAPISGDARFRDRLENIGSRAAMERSEGERRARDDSRRRLQFSGFFDAELYAHHPYDHAEFPDPFRHFVEVGSLEGLPFCSPARLRERIDWVRKTKTARPELAYVRKKAVGESRSGARVDIFVSSTGSPLYREMAELLAEGLTALGAHARLADEGQPPEARADERIVVAPHEFFQLGRGHERYSDEFLARSRILMAEAPGSKHFSMGVWFAQRALGILDVNPVSAYAWSEMGFQAHFLPLGRVPAAETKTSECRDSMLRGALGRGAARRAPPLDAPLSERPIDVFLDAEWSERRGRFLARQAAFFASRRCALFMPAPSLRPSSDLESALTREEASVIAQRSKIHLALGREEVPHFDWYRGMVRGMWQGSLLVTEPGLHVPGLAAGEHYIECQLAEIPETLYWLIETPDGRAEAESVRNRGLAALVERYSPGDILAHFLGDAIAAPGASPAHDVAGTLVDEEDPR